MENILRRINLFNELSMPENRDIHTYYIDLFCGAGGTSTGVEDATIDGRKVAKVIACVNHDEYAIASHMANHPNALHFTEDIRTLDITPITNVVKMIRFRDPMAYIVLWASLECTNFSKAKGGLPRDPDSRTLAEHLFRYIEGIDPDAIQIENVEEFMSWGDLDENGKPISKDKGRLYKEWISNVMAYGYCYDHRILNSADFGARTSRKRFFGQFAKHLDDISWPVPTHSKDGKDGKKKWKPVKDVLDLDNEGISIFGRKKDLSPKTYERIYAGLEKFAQNGKETWMLKYNSINGKTGRHIPPSIEDPCPTISCQGRLGIVNSHFLSKYYSGHPESKNISIEGPAHTIKCKDNHSLVSTKFMTSYYSTGKNIIGMDSPCPTITTKDKFSLVSSRFFANYYSCGGQLSSINNPCPCLTTSPKQALIGCKYDKRQYLMNPQYMSAGRSIEDPCFTLIARMDKRPPYLISAKETFDSVPDFVKIDKNGNVFIEVYDTDIPIVVKIKEFMVKNKIIDILMRMLEISELKRIMGFPEKYILKGTKVKQKKYIGNAVEVGMSRSLCIALVNNRIKLKQKIA